MNSPNALADYFPDEPLRLTPDELDERIPVGEVLLIHQKPFTNEHPEGMAELVSIERVYQESHFFILEGMFRFKDEPETLYFRTYVEPI